MRWKYVKRSTLPWCTAWGKSKQQGVKGGEIAFLFVCDQRLARFMAMVLGHNDDHCIVARVYKAVEP